MPRGICQLCLKEADLRRSHLIGKALYALLREDRDDPVIMTPKYVTPSQREIWAYLLCGDCEQRFSTFGEDPVMKLIQRKGDFRLLNFMNVAVPWRNHLNVATYSGVDMGVNTEEIAYFALSVIWRAGVRTWTTSKRERTGISLGNYQEPVRQYLIGEAALPGDIVVIVTVCEDWISQTNIFAPTLKKDSRYPTYSMLTRGLLFDVIMTPELPQEMRDLCCVRSVKKVLFRRTCEDRTLRAGSNLLKTAKVSKKLASAKAE